MINKKQVILKELKQKLESSWSGFTQVVEEIENIEDVIKYDITKDKEDLEVFYENYLDEIKYQAELLQGETQEAIEKFESSYSLNEKGEIETTFSFYQDSPQGKLKTYRPKGFIFDKKRFTIICVYFFRTKP